MAPTVSPGLRLGGSVFRSGFVVPAKHVLAKKRFEGCFGAWFFITLLRKIVAFSGKNWSSTLTSRPPSWTWLAWPFRISTKDAVLNPCSGAGSQPGPFASIPF